MSATDPAISDLIKRADDARRSRDGLRVEYAEDIDKPQEQRDLKRELALAESIVAAEKTFVETSEHLKQTFPAYTALAEPNPIKLNDFRTHLKAGEALVALPLGTKESWVVLVTRDRLVARPLSVTKDGVGAQIAGLRRAFEPLLGRPPKYDLKEAFSLYSELLGPVATELAGSNRMIFVAQGALSSLPLSVLVTQAPRSGQDQPYVAADWLVKQIAVSEVPSIRAFVSLRQAETRRTPPALPFLAFADPAFTGSNGSGFAAIESTCRQGDPISADLLRALTPLPETATEARSIAQLLGAAPDSVHTGTDATETVLRQQKLDQYGVLYFATHGLLPGELRCQSEPGIALSPPATPATTKADDGLLEASEIAGLKLNADLVVLSACNTAENAGRFGGDSLSGLSEAFFYAGARGLIASHWQVPSQETVALMTELFSQVKIAGTAEALRQSQLKLLQRPETAHPYYWAAFTLIGDGLVASETVASRQ